MALDNLKLQLLPRPKRSILSSGPELTRAIFPNFANVDQLRNFMNRIFNWQMTIPNIYIQLKAVIGLLIIGIIIVCLVLARRKYEGKLSIFRTIRKPTGTIIVVSFPKRSSLHGKHNLYYYILLCSRIPC